MVTKLDQAANAMLIKAKAMTSYAEQARGYASMAG